jgi:hypothetical protein
LIEFQQEIQRRDPETRPRRVVRFIQAESATLASNQCEMTVELRHDSGESFIGRAVGTCEVDQAVHSTALAALDAVRQASGMQPDQLSLYGVSLSQVLGKRTVFVVVAARMEDNVTTALLGSCLVTGDTNRATALAVLNATNRCFGLG